MQHDTSATQPLTAKQIKFNRDKQKEDTNDLVFSYLALRRFIGIVGILLPVALVLIARRAENERVIQASISAYYYTSAGDVFVITICVLCAFLLTYKGYDTMEKILLRLAAVCGVGLTLFPTKWKEDGGMLANSAHVKHTDVPGIGELEFHWIFAAVFFLSLSTISIFFFTKSRDQDNLIEKADDQWLTQKSWRNIIYITMGIIMVVTMVVILTYAVSNTVKKAFGDFSLIYFMALWRL